MNNNGFEIERKYLIRYPNLTILGRNAEATDIVQTYLLCPEPGSSERVRKRGADGEYVYTHTMKTRVSNMRSGSITNISALPTRSAELYIKRAIVWSIKTSFLRSTFIPSGVTAR